MKALKIPISCLADKLKRNACTIVCLRMSLGMFNGMAATGSIIRSLVTSWSDS